MAYFVTYQLSHRQGGRTAPKNVILLTTHPVTWAVSAPKTGNRADKQTFLLFWTDFPNHKINQKVKDYFEVER